MDKMRWFHNSLKDIAPGFCSRGGVPQWAHDCQGWYQTSGEAVWTAVLPMHVPPP